MFSFIKSKDVKSFKRTLEKKNFFADSFTDFKSEEICLAIIRKKQLHSFRLFICQEKMNQTLILKSALLVLRFLQMSTEIVEPQVISQILISLESKAYALPRKSQKQIQCSTSQTAKSILNISHENTDTYNNPQTFFLDKILKPLLLLQDRVLHCYDMIYKPKHMMNLDLCWATINLLKRYTDLNRPMAEMGRYYNFKYLSPMIAIIKIIHRDINVLYKRVKNYLNQQLSTFYTQTEEYSQHLLQQSEKEKLEQLLLLADEVQKVNESIRGLYHSKYFIHILIGELILIPQLFRSGIEIEMVEQVLRADKMKKNRRTPLTLVRCEKEII